MPDSAESVCAQLLQQPEGTRVLVTFEVPLPESLPWEEARAGFERSGFRRVLLDGQARADRGAHRGAAVAAGRRRRSAGRPRRRRRRASSIRSSRRSASARAAWRWSSPTRTTAREPHAARLECPRCNIAYREPTSNLFSFNSPLGACETCRGFGRIIDLDLDLVIPDPRKTLADGAIKPWSTKATEWERGELLSFCRKKKIPTDVPFEQLQRRSSGG